MDRYLYKRSTAKAEENKKRERELDEIIPIQDLMEPFSTDEEEEYVLPVRKKQKTTEPSADEVRPNKRKAKKPIKRLSRVERLARLKRKTQMFDEAKKAAASGSSEQTKQNHDMFFTQKPTQTPTKDMASCVLRDMASCVSFVIEEKSDEGHTFVENHTGTTQSCTTCGRARRRQHSTKNS